MCGSCRCVCVVSHKTAPLSRASNSHFEKGGNSWRMGRGSLRGAIGGNTAPTGRKSTGGGGTPAWAEMDSSPKRAAEETGWSVAPSGLYFFSQISGGGASLAPVCDIPHLRCLPQQVRLTSPHSPPKTKMRIAAQGRFAVCNISLRNRIDPARRLCYDYPTPQTRRRI